MNSEDMSDEVISGFVENVVAKVLNSVEEDLVREEEEKRRIKNRLRDLRDRARVKFNDSPSCTDQYFYDTGEIAYCVAYSGS